VEEKAQESEGWIDPVVEAYKAGVDLTLIRENLKLTPDERLRKLQRRLRAAEELRRAGQQLRRQFFDGNVNDDGY